LTKRKYLAIGIILLLIRIAIAPTITFQIVKASTDNDLVEVTIQACGIQGYGDTTVKLTREQYQDLENYLVEFRARLNQTATREEATPIFKEAVVELDTYGLLPKSMSVQQAQRFVIGQPLITRLSTQLMDKTWFSLAENENMLCLLAGSMAYTSPHTIIDNTINRVFWLFLPFYQQHPSRFMEFILDALVVGYMGSFVLAMLLFYAIPLHLFLTIGMGEYAFGAFLPAVGHLTTIGFNGLKQWSGAFSGALPFLHRIPFPWEDTPGIYGFTGLAWWNVFSHDTYDDETFYLGSALWVAIEPY
jgi:hypothetical protein